MHTFLQRLIVDHKRLLRLLLVLERQLESFHAEQEHDLDLTCELVQYIKSYADQIHHPTEDAMFAKYKSLSSQKYESVVLLEQQHRELAVMARKFHNALEAIIQGDIIPRQGIEIPGQAMIKLLREHIAVEENEVFPLINDRFNNEDWLAVEKFVPRELDPVFERPDPLRFRTLLRHLAV